jgi:hypothetical protein
VDGATGACVVALGGVGEVIALPGAGLVGSFLIEPGFGEPEIGPPGLTCAKATLLASAPTVSMASALIRIFMEFSGKTAF